MAFLILVEKSLNAKERAREIANFRFYLDGVIITILVMTILLGIGVPSYLKFKEDNLLQGQGERMSV